MKRMKRMKIIFSFTLVLTMIFGMLSNTAVNAEDNDVDANPLIASMKFDNNLMDDANQENLEGKGNYSYVDGVLPGTKALHVESGDGNYVGTTHSLNFGSDSFTTSFWYKGDTKDNQVILSNKDFTKSSNAGWAIYTSANSVNMNLGFPDNSVKFGRDTFNASTWRHVTFVVDRDKMLGSLYIDGYEMAETSLGVGTLDTPNPLNIGGDGLGKFGGNSFDIADLSVWKGALSSDIVQANYKSYGVNKVDMNALNDTIAEANTIVAGGLGDGFSQTDFDYLKKVLNTATTITTTQNVKLYTPETINYYKRELSSAIFIYEKSNKTLTPAGLNVIIDSDPEVGDDPGVIDARVKMYTKELSLFPQADVMFIPGDITGQDNDVAMKGMQKIHTQLTNEGKLKNTKWYMVRGNHDGAGSQNFIPIGSAGAWNPSTNSYDNNFYNDAYRVNVKGYNFVGFDGNINSSSTVGKATNLLNQIKNEADYDPTKPIFVSSHFPISGTVWSGQWSSGASNSVGKYIADNNFSQVVYMSGHTQYDPTDERSHYQGAATYLDSGASSYSSYIDDGPYGGYIEGSYINYLTTPKIVNFLEVYGSRMIIKQYNLATDEYVGTPSVKIVGEGKDAFTYSRKDIRELIAPQLDEGSIKVDYLDFNNNGVGFTLKQATDNVRVLEYNIQLINKLTGKVDKSFNSLSMPMEKPYEVYKKYQVTGLSPNTPYIIRVFADDSMYNRSSQDIDILAQNINLNSITAPADAIDVAFGAAKTADALGLPKSVSLVTDDAIRVDAKVSWDVDASNYDPNVATPQTFNVNGTVTLPTIVTNLNNVPLTTSIRVFVNKFSVSTATATATASSYANDRYLPNKVIDGIKGGEPGVGEWTGGNDGDQGRWIQVNWPTNQTINSITFYDRANIGDWTKGGKLTFSDGSTETVSGIPNDGSGYSVHFPTRKVTWVKFQLSGQGNMGLSEMEFSWIVPAGVPLNLMSIKAPADITQVAIGTAKTADALGLPKKVSLDTDAYSVDANVTWNVDASNYDPTVKTGQTFTVNGTVALPKGVANPNNVPLTTSIRVSVNKIPQSQMTATATSEETGKDIASNAIDGNPQTIWHTKWDKSDVLPQSITLKLGTAFTIDKVTYLPRPGGGNGNITGYNVYVSKDGVTFTKVASGTWANDSAEKVTTFDPTDALYVKLEATAGHNGWASAAEINVFAVEHQPPTTTDNAPSGWVNQDVTVTLSASDIGSGVANTYYIVDDGAKQTGTSVVLSEEGAHKLVYWSVDKVGNVEQAHTVSVSIDKKAPSIAVTVPGDNSIYEDSGDLTPQIALTDNLSGVDSSKTKVTLDSQSYQIGTTIPLYKLPLGQHTLVVSSSDLAGNQVSKTVQFKTATSIDSLKALVKRFANNKEISKADVTTNLLAKLANNDLKGFMNDVKAQSGKSITSNAAKYLLRDAQYLLTQK